MARMNMDCISKKIVQPQFFKEREKLFGVLVLNFKALFSARIEVRKKNFCAILAGKQKTLSVVRELL